MEDRKQDMSSRHRDYSSPAAARLLAPSAPLNWRMSASVWRCMPRVLEIPQLLPGGVAKEWNMLRFIGTPCPRSARLREWVSRTVSCETISSVPLKSQLQWRPSNCPRKPMSILWGRLVKLSRPYEVCWRRTSRLRRDYRFYSFL